MVRISI